MTVRAHVRLTLDSAQAGAHSFHFPSGSRTLLYRFLDGTPDELVLGASAYLDDQVELVPGGQYDHVILEFWADEGMVRRVVVEGDSFIIWHGEDIGAGVVLSVE